MLVASQIVALVLVVLLVTALARRTGRPAPALLVVAGVAVSYLPGLPAYRLDPELVLFGLLPPLLYGTAYTSSLPDMRANRGPIALLSVGLVAFTTVVVGVVTWWVLPGLPAAAGFALGAVVAPSDAVSATAVARRVGIPRRIVRILEGESLLNDAVALVGLRTALVGLAGAVSAWWIAGSLALAAVGGVVIGLVVTAVFAGVRRLLRDPVTDTALSLVIPFVAYVAAEAVHASGVLAVVLTGLLLGHQAPRLMSGAARSANRVNWRTIEFLLENVVFLLIGLQLRQILTDVAEAGPGLGVTVAVCASVFVAAVLSRFVWVYGVGAVRRLGGRRAWPWSYSAVVSWAGMRGVITLAAAFALPTAVPYRSVLVLAAFVVVAATLLVQGTTLGWLVRRLRIPAPDPGQDTLQEAALLGDMAQAARQRLEEVRAPDDQLDVVERLRERLQVRTDSAWERLGTDPDRETPSDSYRRLRLEMLAAEWEALLAARRSGTADHVVLQRLAEALDVEESMLERPEETARDRERELRAPTSTAGSCPHLRRARDDVRPQSPDTCQDCVVEGTTWVHLRLCLTCGHVACCDSSPRRHATRHYHDTGHPVVRSHEPGELWRWCYADETLG
ncbi:Na+/H+ antiporter [Saccharopolyspora rosea]|uniref:Na+/H+ antiporter n=1 Tax=Saccharopolyspora rosea TaxID=524884 RepID=A0ABW3FVM2_9PSEU|nr:Na+/H+ antiporter [Saccharopolyspora rosea]